MRVLLVQSWLGGAEAPVYPIGLACIATQLKEHDVKIVDPNISSDTNDPYQKIGEILTDWSPDIVGVSLRNIDSTNTRISIYYYDHFKELIAYIRTRSSAKIVAGGAGFSLFSQRIMEETPAIDFGVYLEGEHSFAELLQQLSAPWAVKGIYYRQQGNVHFTGAPDKLITDASKEVFENGAPLQDYPLQQKGLEPVGVESKRGCGLNCIYCPYGFLNGKSYRLFSPSKVVDQIEALYKDYGVTSFTFLDSVFNIPVDHANAICDEFISRKLPIRWSAWFNEKTMDKAFIEKCIRSGCHTFIMRPDAFEDTTLQKLGKAQRVRDIRRVWLLLKEISLTDQSFEVSYNFFKNPPGQTWKGFFKLFYFLFKAKLALKNRMHFEVNTLRVEPHTALEQIAIEDGVCNTNTDLLTPVFYSQQRTAFIEAIWNKLLKAIGK